MLLHMCVCMYTSHSIKQMAGRGSEKNKSCETRGIERSRTKREQWERDPNHYGGVERTK